MCMMHGVRIHNMQGVFGVGAVCGVCVSVHKYKLFNLLAVNCSVKCDLFYFTCIMVAQ